MIEKPMKINGWIFMDQSTLYDLQFTGWDDEIVALEKKTWFHFRLMKTSFLFLLQTIY